MDFLTPLLILCVILSACLAAFFAAESRGRKATIIDKDELIGVLRAELKDWQNKALFRQGVTPLGRETEKHEPKKADAANGMPRVAMRSQLQARAHGAEAPSITIHAQEVVNPRTQDTIEKAKEILNGQH